MGGPDRKKERKQTPKEGWEDGTPPPYRDFKERRENFFFSARSSQKKATFRLLARQPMHKSLLLLSLLSGCAALVVSPARVSAAAASRCAAPTALAPVDASAVHSVASLVAEIVQADGERAYGAVDAPLWVLPVGAIAVVATALVPMCGCTLHYATPPPQPRRPL